MALGKEDIGDVRRAMGAKMAKKVSAVTTDTLKAHIPHGKSMALAKRMKQKANPHY